MKETLTRLKLAERYTFDRPVPAVEPIILNDLAAIKHAFNDPEHFKTGYSMDKLGNGYGFMITMDDRTKCVYFSGGGMI
jgi:linoleate 10R-lipoxygenase